MTNRNDNRRKIISLEIVAVDYDEFSSLLETTPDCDFFQIITQFILHFLSYSTLIFFNFSY